MACWALAVVASLVWVEVRPPCPPGYVRLVDLGWLVTVVAGAGALTGVLALLLVASRRLYRTVAVVMCASTALALLVAIGTADSIITDSGHYDSGCWTF